MLTGQKKPAEREAGIRRRKDGEREKEEGGGGGGGGGEEEEEEEEEENKKEKQEKRKYHSMTLDACPMEPSSSESSSPFFFFFALSAELVCIWTLAFCSSFFHPSVCHSIPDSCSFIFLLSEMHTPRLLDSTRPKTQPSQIARWAARFRIINTQPTS